MCKLIGGAHDGATIALHDPDIAIVFLPRQWDESKFTYEFSKTKSHPIPYARGSSGHFQQARDIVKRLV